MAAIDIVILRLSHETGLNFTTEQETDEGRTIVGRPLMYAK